MSNKIRVIICGDAAERLDAVARMAVLCGFARTVSDAKKVVEPGAPILSGPRYFILSATYNFRESPYTNQRLFEMAARGMAVIVGCRSLPREFEFLCDIHTPDDLIP